MGLSPHSIPKKLCGVLIADINGPKGAMKGICYHERQQKEVTARNLSGAEESKVSVCGEICDCPSASVVTSCESIVYGGLLGLESE